jgi:hypothetical protein
MTTDLHSEDAFRNAFQAIMQASVMFMDHDAYFRDILIDARTATALRPEQHFYLVVRRLGTHSAESIEDAIRILRSDDSNMAIVRVYRGKYDAFRSKVLVTRKDGYVEGWEEL